MNLKFALSPKRIRSMLVIIAIIITILSLISEYLVEFVFAAQQDAIFLYFLDLFSVNLEASIPTWYSVLILAIAAVLLFVIARAKSKSHDSQLSYWWGLGFIFLYFSLDEGASIHEIFATPLQQAFNTSGFLAFGWQIIAFPLVIIFGLVYLRFLLQLPTKTRNWFIFGAILYAGGALIFEGFSASQYDESTITMTYLGLATIEEFCEILGVSLFIFALLDYIEQMGYRLDIATESTTTVSANEPSLNKRQSQKPKTSPVSNPMIWLILFLIVTNVASMGWILANRPQEYVYEIPQFYEPVLAELEAANITIVEVPDLFGITNRHSLNAAQSLAETNSEIYVVTFPSENRSVILAGDNILFDRNTITEWLHNNGQVEFIIFDPTAVAVIIAN